MNAARARPAPALELLARPGPLLIGHRGFAHAAPENTLPSFRLALAEGVDLVELDYQASRDRVPLVIHDSTLDRTTDAPARWRQRHIQVAARTAADTQNLDAGAWFNPRFAGARVPLLAEALQFIQTNGLTLIERKTGSAADCLCLLRQMGLVNHVVVQSFDWKFLRLLHEEEPAQVLAALGPPALLANGKKPSPACKHLAARCLDELQKTGARVAVWNRHLPRAAVERAHARGLKVWVYTVDTLRLANRLLRAGVDGLITNNPRLLKQSVRCRPQVGL
ncbi:conserved hypothetical protein [Verrucomicrobia bacterium]|nr:conserved hypothetical protein [Verrucomicrobiota bacterium]